MATFSLFITKAPYDANNAHSALMFCREALALGHCIEHVFFYAEGTQIASSLSSFNNGETDIQALWIECKLAHNVPLKVCTTAGIRRGIACAEDNMGFNNYNQHFEPVGMLEYFSALRSNKVKSIQF